MHKFNFSSILLEAGHLIRNASHPSETERGIDLLIRHLEKYPMGLGAADAVHLIGIAHMGTYEWHRAEIAFLVAYCLRFTRLDPYLHYNSLINIIKCCNDLKSFSEAFEYGHIAEKMDPSDSDLMTNMALAAYFLNLPEKGERIEKLNEKHPGRLRELYDLIEEWKEKNPPAFDASLISERLESNFTLDDYKKIVEGLNRDPDGESSWKGWEMLSRAYQSGVANTETKYYQLQQQAGLLSAASKAVNLCPPNYERRSDLMMWRIGSLGEMGFAELAKKELDGALLADPVNPLLRRAKEQEHQIYSVVEQYYERHFRSPILGRKPFKRGVKGRTVCFNIVVLNAIHEEELYKMIAELKGILLIPFWRRPSAIEYEEKRQNELAVVMKAQMKWGRDRIILFPDRVPSGTPYNCLIGPDSIAPEAWVSNAIGMEYTTAMMPDYKKALNNFERAVRISRFYFEALYNMAACLGIFGDRSGAIAYYNMALDIAPEDEDIKAEIISMFPGQAGLNITSCPHCRSQKIFFVFNERNPNNGWMCKVCGWSSFNMTFSKRQSASSSQKPECFIATSAYGDADHSKVLFLREFRDRYLLKNALGKSFVERYYQFSPAIAAQLEELEVLRKIIRKGLDVLIFILRKILRF